MTTIGRQKVDEKIEIQKNLTIALSPIPALELIWETQTNNTERVLLR